MTPTGPITTGTGNIPVFEKMENYACCGCEACANVCPVKIISMKADKYGFLYPHMDKEKCIRCMKCVQTCPALKPSPKARLLHKAFAGYAKDEGVVKSSSSGGFFELLAKSFLLEKKSDPIIVAVVWAKDFKSTYHICGGHGDIEQMKRSKYIQSKKGDIYSAVETQLKAGKEILFVGCPCEVAGLHSVLAKEYENLYCIDLVCQGPTSPQIMAEYVSAMERRYKSRITDINLRYVGDKVWIPQWAELRFANGKKYLRSFYETSLGIAFHLMQRPSCYQCLFLGNNRYADITLGDYHGADPTKNYYNANGTSILIANTEKGEGLLKNLSLETSYIEPADYSDIVAHNPRLVKTWEPFEGSETFWREYPEKSLQTAAWRALSPKRRLMYRIPTKLRTRLKALLIRIWRR